MSTVGSQTIKADITIQDDSPAVLEAFENALDRAMDAIGEAAGGHAKDIIQQAGRIDTGRMIGDIDSQHDANTVYIGTNVEYAIWHEVGTGVYASDGTGRKTPWWYQDSRGVWHKTEGVKPLHFLQRAATEHSEEYKGILKDSLENA